MSVVIPLKFVDPDSGLLTLEALALLQTLLNGAETYSINTVLSGATQNAAAIEQAQADAIAALSAADAAASNIANAAMGGFVLAAVPSFISEISSTAGTVTTPSVTITPTGGVGPYTYAWTRKSGDASISAVSASSATTTFTATGAVNGDFLSAIYTCTVEDSTSGTPLTAAIDVSVTVVVLTDSIIA